jgi:hypothetical protein
MHQAASLTVRADWIRWASAYQSMLVPMPKPPITAMTTMVRNQAMGKSPPNQPVNANGLSRWACPSASSLATIAVGPPAWAMPQNETIRMAMKAMIPCWKSAITTPQ